ncbi:MAG: DUF3300 domain-containing protein [Opitutaceae bacterium]
MKTFRVPLALFLLTMAVRAQDAVPPDPAATVPLAVQRTAEELDQLLAPIALYPDALIALILPASTAPTDIVLAARHVRDNPGDRSQVEHRAWDESVKSLTNYPEVLRWMDENLQWTRQVGEAFAVQPADVMQAVQRLRTKARAAGTLVDTPQQQVIAEQQVIRIVPAQPDVIYVPHYEPEVVFVSQPVYYTRPFLTFGVGVPVGSWLAFDCDWRHNRIWVGNRHRRWAGHDWHRPLVPFAHAHNHGSQHHVSTPAVRQWRPPQAPRITVTSSNRFRSEVARPAPLGFASSPPNGFRDSGARTFRDTSSSSPRSPRDSGSSSFRGSSAVNRTRSVDSPPVVPALPRSFSPGFRSEVAGPRAAAPAVPPLPTARSINRLNTSPSATATVQPAPSVQPAPPVHRPGNAEGFRDHRNRSRSFRSSQSVVTPPLPMAPAIPMTTPARSAQSAGPRMAPSFSRRSTVPAVAPAIPIHNRASAPAAVGPVAPQVTPQAAPAQRGGGESRSGGESRGQRGASRGGRFSS